jgi:hypothetical protein
MDLSKFRSHPRGVKQTIPKPKRQNHQPHVSTARLLDESKENHLERADQLS